MGDVSTQLALLKLQASKLATQRQALDRQHQLFLATHKEFGVIRLESLKRQLRANKQTKVARQSKNDAFWSQSKVLRERFVSVNSRETAAARQLKAAQQDMMEVAEAMYPSWAETMEEKRIQKIKDLERMEKGIQQRRQKAKHAFDKEHATRELLVKRAQDVLQQRELEHHEAGFREHSRSQLDETIHRLSAAKENLVAVEPTTQRPTAAKRPKSPALVQAPSNEVLYTYQWQALPIGVAVADTRLQQRLDPSGGGRSVRIPDSWVLHATLEWVDSHVSSEAPGSPPSIVDLRVHSHMSLVEVIAQASSTVGCAPESVVVECNGVNLESFGPVTIRDLGYDFFSGTHCILANRVANQNLADTQAAPSPPRASERHVMAGQRMSAAGQPHNDVDPHTHVGVPHEQTAGGTRREEPHNQLPPSGRKAMRAGLSPTNGRNEAIQKKLQDRMMMSVVTSGAQESASTSSGPYPSVRSPASGADVPSRSSALQSPTSTRDSAQSSPVRERAAPPQLPGWALKFSSVLDLLEQHSRYNDLRGSAYGQLGGSVEDSDRVAQYVDGLDAEDEEQTLSFSSGDLENTDLLCEVVLGTCKAKLSELIPSTVLDNEHVVMDTQVVDKLLGDYHAGSDPVKGLMWDRLIDHARYIVRERIMSLEKCVNMFHSVLLPRGYDERGQASKRLHAVLKMYMNPETSITQDARPTQHSSQPTQHSSQPTQQSSRSRVLSYDEILGGSAPPTQEHPPTTTHTTSSPKRKTPNLDALLRFGADVSDDEVDVPGIDTTSRVVGSMVDSGSDDDDDDF